MEVLCTIGSQGLSDGRRFFRGDVYEVDDEIASTLILNGYAERHGVVEETVADDDVVKDVVDDTAAPKMPKKTKTSKHKRR